MPTDRNYNVDQQLLKIMYVMDDVLEFFCDIKTALDLGEDFPTITALISRPFDPFKTVGKY
jgi:hypothetical protein